MWVEITLYLPPWAEGLSYLPPSHPWVCTHGEMPSPPEGPSAGKLEELSIGSAHPVAQQTHPQAPRFRLWLLGKWWCVIVSSQHPMAGLKTAAGLKTLHGHALHVRIMSGPYKNPAGWPCQMLVQWPGKGNKALI